MDPQSSRLHRACQACRIAKIKCRGLGSSEQCERCASAAIPCVLLPVRRGRMKGSKKWDRCATCGAELTVPFHSRKTLERLHMKGLTPVGITLPQTSSLSMQAEPNGRNEGTDSLDLFWTQPSTPDLQQSPALPDKRSSVLARLEKSFPTAREADIEVAAPSSRFYEKDVENPLLFFAECARRGWDSGGSKLPIPPPVSILPPADAHLLGQWGFTELENMFQDQRVFFQHGLYGSKRDVSGGLDAVQRGVIGEDEVQELFNEYYQYCHPQWPVLDPVHHTPHYVRTHSAYLFTTLLATGALSIASLPSSTPRQCVRAQDLHSHVEKLQMVLCATAAKSVEIIQAELMLQGWELRKARIVDDQAWTRLGMATRMASSIGLYHRNWNAANPVQTSQNVMRLRIALILAESRWESISDRKVISPELQELSRDEVDSLLGSSPFNTDALIAADYALHRFELESKGRLQRYIDEKMLDTALDCEKVWINTYLESWEEQWCQPHADPLVKWHYRYASLRSRMVGLLRIARAQTGKWSAKMRKDLLTVSIELLEGALSHDRALHMLRTTDPLVFACTIVLQSTGPNDLQRDLVLRLALRLAGNPIHDIMTFPKHNGYQILNMLCLSESHGRLDAGPNPNPPMDIPSRPLEMIHPTAEAHSWADLEQLFAYNGHIDFPYFGDSSVPVAAPAGIAGTDVENGPVPTFDWSDVTSWETAGNTMNGQAGLEGGMAQFYNYVASALGH